jgi:hypothetical protein
MAAQPLTLKIMEKYLETPTISADLTGYFTVRSIENWTARKSDKYSDDEACFTAIATGQIEVVEYKRSKPLSMERLQLCGILFVLDDNRVSITR